MKKVPKKPVKNEPIHVSGGDVDPGVRRSGAGGAQVHVAVGKTVNIGNFESLRVDYAETDGVREDESFEDARERVTRSVLAGFDSLLTETLDVLKS